MIKVKETVIVEGKYDKIRLSSLLDAVIIETNGFGIFRDRDRLNLIRRLAAETGIIIMTDSDAAGFQIRAKLASCIPQQQIKHAYMPDRYGKERRKDAPSGEGKLGVEGMDAADIEEALRQCGALDPAVQNAPAKSARADLVTKADLYLLGLSGGKDSRVYRRRLMKQMNLPEHLSVNALIQVINTLYTRDDFVRLARDTVAHSEKPVKD